ncbi:hypothetical protein P4G95_17015 [Burkholderia vietnamiensis]|jgi:hypothetical protein|uniref:Uncharacterized protein n=1 Tax=Burkholderia vietnamiensis TaxID=60552 RepID=A0AAW7SXQ3_BURVI|nr:hypothetical protein [Burkholderia vietnamiensis]KKI38646.1 hypothetical protein VI03_12170 [Burkholderia vietnamiensis]KVE64952.1 hypothetical protein WI96_12295 [Burkholderia vietnamiensis]MDN7794378.1 hypothetical protein [Burkholderia vietnamiensis]QTK87518.1 hypothetical protein J4D21_18065 [Burkholderia vietnamiensis]WHU94899.1 hypothetical protein P4G95_17015 [Burkholderia vietnamiensis]
MSRPGLRRRYRGFAAGVDVGVDVDAARVARIASMAAAFVSARTQPATFRPTNGACSIMRAARDPQLHCRIGRSAVSAGDEFGRNRIA